MYQNVHERNAILHRIGISICNRLVMANCAAVARMTIDMAGHIRACLDRAAAAERLAAREGEPAAKAELLELAGGWRQVAADYQYVQKLENFLKTHRVTKASLPAH